MAFDVTIHVTAAIIWLGGIFIALVAAEPAAKRLGPVARLEFRDRFFGRVLISSWVFAVALVGSGVLMTLAIGGSTPTYIRTMMGLGSGALLAQAYASAFAWRKFKGAAKRYETPAASHFTHFKIALAVTAVLGIAAAIVGAAGPYFS